MTGRARLQPAEEQTVPGRRRKMPQTGLPFEAKVPTPLAGPTTILEAHAVDAGVANRADMPSEETCHVGVEWRRWVVGFQRSGFVELWRSMDERLRVSICCRVLGPQGAESLRVARTDHGG